jgi:hypothetical protein
MTLLNGASNNYQRSRHNRSHIITSNKRSKARVICIMDNEFKSASNVFLFNFLLSSLQTLFSLRYFKKIKNYPVFLNL